jgi:hypothetical protein
MDAIALCITFAKANGKGEIHIQIPLRGIVASIIPIKSIEMHQQTTTGVHRVHLPFHQMKWSLQQVQRIRP